jgi:hypothetical protein
MFTPLVRALLVLLCSAASVMVTTEVTAQSTSLAAALEDISWGDSAEDVLAVYAERERQAYLLRIEGMNDPLEIDRLRREADALVARIANSRESFDITQTGYEVSAIRGEVVGTRGQSMVSVRQGDTSRYYVFTDNRLVKYMEIFDIAALGYVAFEGFVERLGQVLGRPESSDYQEDDIGVRKLVRAAWSDGDTRLRVEDRSSMFAAYLLVYTDASVTELTVNPEEVARAMAPAGRSSISDMLARASADSETRTAANRDVVDDIIGQRTVIELDNSSEEAAALADSGPSALDDTEVFEDAPRMVRERRAAPTSPRPSQQTQPASTGTEIY